MMALTLLSAAIGVALLALGWRGRLVDSNLFCSACRFELTGTMRAAVAAESQESAVCPECGVALNKPRAFKRGRREPRPKVIWTGAIVVGLLALWGACHWWMSAAGVTIEQWEPFWLVRDSAVGRFGSGSVASQKELVRRIRQGLVSKAEITELVTLAAKRQPLLHKPWGAWGEIVGAAEKAGCVTPQQTLRFDEEQWRLFVTMRKKRLRVGDPLELEIECEWRPVVRTSRDFGSVRALSLRVSVKSLKLGDNALAGGQNVLFDLGSSGPPSWFSQTSRGGLAKVDARPGHHRLRGRVLVAWIDRSPNVPERQVGEEVEVELDLPLEVLPVDP